MEEEATAAIEIEHHELRAFATPDTRRSASQGGSFLSRFSVTSCVISYTRFARVLVYTFVILTCIPFTVGAAFTSIFLKHENFHALFPAFFMACLSLGTLSILVMHLLRKIEKYHDSKTMEGLKLLGMLASVESGISLGVYTILTFLSKQDFQLDGPNYFSTAIFSGLCLLCSLQLYISAQWYQNALQASAAISNQGNTRALNSTTFNH